MLDAIKAASRKLSAAKADLAVACRDYMNQVEGGDYNYMGSEVGPELAISRRKADAMLSRGYELTERPAILLAMAEGRIDESKALLILDQISVLSESHKVIVEDDLLEYAETRTYTSVRRHAQTVIHKLDPDAALRRHKKATKERAVEKRDLDDGMSSLRFVVPALEGVLIYDRIDRIARALPKDDRTLDQKRADVAMDVLLGKETGAPQGEVRVYLTMPVTSVIGMNDDPAMLHGYGPLPAEIARDVAAGGIWKRILTDPVTGMAEEVSDVYRPTAKQRELIAARFPRCTAIGCQQPAHRCDLDHCCRYDGTNTTVKNLRPKCRHHHRMKHETSWRCENLDDGRHVWTSPRGKVYETELEPIAEPAPF
ncbi:HNH endonuclease [Allokutzneria sp. A3M-2-11 16]|uniref:HNH endonuclease signature motif containing protein n=1 Tax=Allokutzneria sp. A3M-2-11 16 TaxID=2962043 RepID=UPI0020B8BF90|nr:HNH endonuclease signature motif containing protein [Allokutzneria sp. A3M-2-11 16]MCP3802270.1 HNH endonuclease [Allokutzneria sp. A3M-2-11 16]